MIGHRETGASNSTRGRQVTKSRGNKAGKNTGRGLNTNRKQVKQRSCGSKEQNGRAGSKGKRGCTKSKRAGRHGTK